MKPANQIKRQAFRFRKYLPIMVAWIIFLSFQSQCYAYDVTLNWVADLDPTVIGYKVYYQQDSTAIPFNASGAAEGPSPIDNHALTTAKVSGLDPNRAYYFAVTKYYSTGEESPYSNIVSVPEGFPPTVTVTSPADNALVSGIISVATEALDNVGVTGVEIYVNGQLLTTETAAPYLFSWDTSGLASGVYVITAKAYDAAGNVGKSVGVSVNVINDTTPPTVSISTPFNNATVSGVVPVDISTSDNIGVSKVELYRNGELLFVSNVPPYNYAWNTTAIADGNYTLSAKSYDASGNIGQSDNVVVRVNNDTVAPVVTINSPYSNSTLSGTVAVNASASDNVGVSKVEFYLNGILKSTTTAAPYSFSWNTTTAANGAYVLSAIAYDAVGNIGQANDVVVSVNNATSTPFVAITTPSSNVTLNGTVSVNATASASAGVSKVEFYINGGLQARITTAPYSFSWHTTTVANGSYTLSAKAYDALGSVGQSANVTVSVVNDAIAPVVAISSPSNNAELKGTVTITANASDNISVARVEFYVNGVLRSSDTSAPYSFDLDTTSLPNGTYALSAKAYDSVGNIGQSPTVTTTVSNDTIIPTVNTFTVPISATSLSVPISNFSATDNVGVTGYLITESSVAPIASATGWSASALSGYVFATTGTKTLYAWAKDAAGNVSAAKTATIVISIPKTVEQDVMILDSSTTYSTIQDAYNTVPENGTIAAKDVTLSEDLNFNRAVNVSLEGGKDASFQSTTGTTSVSGVIKISKGKVVVSKIVVR